MFLRVLLIVSLFGFEILAAPVKPSGPPKDEMVVVDELLFDVNGEGVTRYDYKIFDELAKSVERYFAPAVIKSFNNSAEFYVFCSLALREADELDIKSDPAKVERFIQDYKFSDNPKKAEATKNEIQKIFKVAELITIKERQLQNRQTIIAWLVVLKRKYSLGWKSNDFKNRITFGI